MQAPTVSTAREQQARAPRADLVDQEAAHEHRGDRREAVHAVHRPDRRAVGLERLDERRLDRADAVVGEVAAEQHEAREAEDRHPVRARRWVHRRPHGDRDARRRAGSSVERAPRVGIEDDDARCRVDAARARRPRRRGPRACGPGTRPSSGSARATASRRRITRSRSSRNGASDSFGRASPSAPGSASAVHVNESTNAGSSRRPAVAAGVRRVAGERRSTRSAACRAPARLLRGPRTQQTQQRPSREARGSYPAGSRRKSPIVARVIRDAPSCGKGQAR